jgi:hypothetical protein
MDKSVLPGLARKSWSLPWGGKKKVKKAPKKTQPGAMDDDALKRAQERNRKLKEAAGD